MKLFSKEETTKEIGSDKESMESRGVGHWSEEEHQKFLDALDLYGKNWKLIQQHVSTRSVTQTRSHAQKYFEKLKKRKNGDRALKKSRDVNYLMEREEKSIIPTERPKKDKVKKVKKKRCYENKLTIEPSQKHCINELEMSSTENSRSEVFEQLLGKLKFNHQEHTDSLHFDSAMMPLMHMEHEPEYHFPLPWDNDLLFEEFNSNPSSVFQHEEAPLFSESQLKFFTDEPQIPIGFFPVYPLQGFS